MTLSSRSCLLMLVVCLLVASGVGFGSAKIAFAPAEIAAPDGCPAGLPALVADSLRRDLIQTEGASFVSENELGAGNDSWRLTGRIVVASAKLSPQEARVELTANLVSQEPGGLRISALDEGVARAEGVKPVAEQDLYAQAGRRAAALVAQQLGMGLRARGQVFKFDGRTQEILITLGANNNLRRTAELVISRGGRQIASAQVFSVWQANAAARITWTSPGAWSITP